MILFPLLLHEMSDFKPWQGSGGRDKNLLFGIHPVMEAILAGKELDTLFIQRDFKNDRIRELKEACRIHQIPVKEVPAEKLNRLTSRQHQGVVGYLSLISYTKLSNIVPALFEKGEIPFILLLDHITDVRNFGALARTAECAGVHAIVIPSLRSAQINSDAIKASAGALSRLPVCREDYLKDSMVYLKQCGLSLIACEETAKKNYFNCDMKGPVAIVMGSEEEGISESGKRLADVSVKIPLLGKINSLNVSVAAGIILFETVRQRKFNTII